MMKQVGIKIRLEAEQGNAEYRPGDRIKVDVFLSVVGHTPIHNVREIMLDFSLSKGLKVLHFDWNMTPLVQRLYRLDGSGDVVRANAIVSKPHRLLLSIATSIVDTHIGTAFLKVRRSGQFSVVGKRITKRRPYDRDAGFRLGAGFGGNDQVWNFDPKRESVIEYNPLPIKVG